MCRSKATARRCTPICLAKAVVADINNYYRNQAYIDLNNLPEDAEATQSVVQATLTEGAIGYRKFKVISGQKAMAYCGCVTAATRRLARK